MTDVRRDAGAVQPVVLHGPDGAPALLQRTAARCAALAFPGAAEPVVVCGEGAPVADELRRAGVRPKGVVLEPAGRGTAPALTLAAIHCVADDDPVLLAMPSDLTIAAPEPFRLAMARGAALAREGYVVAFGVTPDSPAPGLGYILAGAPVARTGPDAARYVEAFVEKPETAAVLECFASGRHFWNSGIFAVRASVWIDAIGCFRPDILAACERALRDARRDGDLLRVSRRAFAECPSDSIDYAVMERIAAVGSPGGPAPEAVMVRLEAGWSAQNASRRSSVAAVYL